MTRQLIAEVEVYLPNNAAYAYALVDDIGHHEDYSAEAMAKAREHYARRFQYHEDHRA
jgi:hypothetical protein